MGEGNHANGHIYNAVQFEGDDRSLIENAIGGSGDDSIAGNQAANDLAGGAGADTLSGAAGDDMLTGGAGDDDIYGGDGADAAVFFGDFATYVFDQVDGFLTVLGEGFDRLWSDVETLIFADVSLAFDAVLEASETSGAAPVAADDALAASAEGTTGFDLFADNGSGADFDADGDALTLVSVNGETDGEITFASGARLTFAADGSANFIANGAYDALGGDETATESFTYLIDDGQGGQDEAVATITIQGVNAAPTAGAAAFSGDEDAAIAGQLTAVDDEPGALTYTLVSGPDHGAVEIAADGSFSYLPDADYFGADSFTYRVTDGEGLFDQAVVNLSIAAVNDAPETAGLSVATDEDEAVAGQLTASDVEGGALTFALAEGPTHGAVVVAADGGFVYTPTGDYSGADAFTYRVTDADGAFALASVTIAVAPVNDAPETADAAFETGEDAPLSGQLTATDIDGDALTFTLTDAPSNGAVEIAASGAFTYTPDGDFHGQDGFGYVVRDPSGAEATGWISLTVTAANDAPEATSLSFSLDEDAALAGQLTASDVDGDALTFALAPGGAPAEGAVQIDADGGFVYAPRADFHGTDSFTFQVVDAAGAIATATVSLTVAPVNDAPTAPDIAFAAVEDVTFTGQLPGTDVEPGALSYSLAPGGGPSHGALTIGDDGAFIYAPDENYFGEDAFTYRVIDADGAAATGVVTLNVSATNDGPVAEDGSFTGVEDGPVAGQLNASDAEPGVLIFSVLASGAPAHGTVTLSEAGGFTYTPDPDFHGVDSFAYQVRDSLGAVDQGLAVIEIAAVNDAPIAAAQAYVVDEDAALSGQLAAADVEGDALTFALADGGAPAHGAVAIDGSGGFTYTPDADFHGADAFTYQVTDAAGAVGEAVVAITVAPVNDAPTAADAAFALAEDSALTGQLATADVDGEALTHSLLDGPAHGEVAVAADGGFTYTATADYTGADSFTYRVVDAAGVAATGEVTLNVTPVNDAPAAADAAFEIDEDGVLVGALPASDIDGEPLTYEIIETDGPVGGTASIDASGQLTYTPAANFNGREVLRYQVRDAAGATATAAIIIDVLPVNDAPVAADDAFTAAADGALSGDLFADNGFGADADADDEPLRIAEVAGAAPAFGEAIILASGAALTVFADGTFLYDPTEAFAELALGATAVDGFDYVAEDAAGAAAAASVEITVDGAFVAEEEPDAPTPPVIDDDPVVDTPDTPDTPDAPTTGGDGADTLTGSVQDDLITGGGGADQIFGDIGDDELRGEAGGDFVNGGAGRDLIFGNGGADTLMGGGQADQIRGGGGRDSLMGQGGADTLDGGGGRDRLFGGGGADDLSGGRGADTLLGGRGSDRLSGDAGRDRLEGGVGGDLFVFTTGDGRDLITDFEQGRDKIVVEIDGADFADLSFAQTGADVLIRHAGFQVLVEDQDVGAFTAGDFIFS